MSIQQLAKLGRLCDELSINLKAIQESVCQLIALRMNGCVIQEIPVGIVDS